MKLPFFSRRSRDAHPGLDLRPQPRGTHLNRRLVGLLAVVLVAIVTAAVLTLSNNAKRLDRDAETAPAPRTAPEEFWKAEPDGVVSPPVPKEPSVDLSAPAKLALEPSSDDTPTIQLSDVSSGPEDQARLEQAMAAAPLVQHFDSQGSRAPSTEPSPLPPSSAPQAIPGAAEALASVGEPDSLIKQNNQAAKRTFIEEAVLDLSEESNPQLKRPADSPYEITAGAIIPAVLVTAASSDLPGQMTARVRENVYDVATGEHLLVPQGTTIVGIYDSVVTYGQARLLVAWQRLIFPDGSKLNIGSMPGVDEAGAAGFEDRVNRHYLRLFGSALLMSAISAGVQISQGGTSLDPRGEGRDVQDTLASALGQQIGELAGRMVRRNLDVQPEISIRPGYRFNLFVQRDLVFATPYRGR